MTNTRSLVLAGLTILLLAGCGSSTDNEDPLPPSEPSIAATPDSPAGPVARDELSEDLQILLADFETVLPAFEAYAKKDGGYVGGGAPFETEGMLDGALDDVEVEIATAYNYGVSEGKLSSLEVLNEESGATVGMDDKGLYFIETMESEKPQDPAFYEAMTELQSAVETFIENNGLVPDLDKQLDTWELTPGYFGESDSAGVVEVKLPMKLEEKGSMSSGTDYWEILLRDPATGDIGRASSDGLSFGVVHRIAE